MLLAGVLGLKRLDLYLQFDRPLTAEELSEFKARLRRRLHHEPLQYIEGVAHFRGLQLQVDSRVLIPRPETEVLVDQVLAWAAGRERPTVADVGTGSGAIALSLLQEGDFSRVVATDISREALDLAEQNARTLAEHGTVEFRQGRTLEPLAGELFDIIVSNPPYIGTRESAQLPTDVREWEPHAALFAGDDGLEIVRELIDHAADHLLPRGLLALEIGEGQGEEVAALVRASPSYGEPAIRQDLTGRDRFLLVEAA